MFFGEEGERLLRQREAAKRKYGDDLRAQIAENQQRFKTTASPQQMQGSPRRKTRNQAKRPGITSPVTQRQDSSHRSSTQRQQFASINNPLPGLPMVVAGASPDVVRFDNRLSRLESWVAQNRSYLLSASENVDRIQRFDLPKLNDNFEHLYGEIDKLAKNDLGERLNPLQNERQQLEQMIASVQADQTTSTNSMRATLDQLQAQLTQARSYFATLKNSANSTVGDFKTALGDCNEMQEAMLRRLSIAESQAYQTEGGLGTAAAAIKQLQQVTDDGIVQTQQQMNGIVARASRQLSQDVKTESEERGRQAASLQRKVEDCVRQTKDGFQLVTNTINDLVTGFQKASSDITDSVQASLGSTRSETERKHHELSAKLDELIAQTERKLEQVQNTSVTRLKELNDHTSKARDDLEALLTKECETRKRNEAQFVEKYDNFKALIVKEMEMQAERLEKLIQETKQKAIQQCQEDLMPIRKDIAHIQEQSRNAETMPQRVQQIKQSVQSLSTQLDSDVAAVKQVSFNVSSQVDRVKAESEQALDSLEERIRVLEEHRSGPDLATTAEVGETFSRLREEFDGRMQEIAQQIMAIRSSLAMARTPPDFSNKKRESGALLIDQLAQTARSQSIV